MDTKNTLSTTEARQRFAEVVDAVGTQGARYTLTVNGKPKAVIINAEELESLQETIDILSDQKLVGRINKAIGELARNEMITLDELVTNDWAV